MNNEDVIRIAREAGCIPRRHPEYDNDIQVFATPDVLERFAALVAAHEREACARVCDGLGVHPALNVFNGGPEWYKHGKDCAAAIRARGNEKRERDHRE